MALNTEQKTLVEERVLEGERAAFASRGVQFEKCVFANGESPLKESRGIALSGCNFEWKYPLWYCDDVQVENCVWLEMARSGVWYTNNIVVSNSVLQAPKNFRRCNGVELNNVTFADAAETLWMCQGVRLNQVQARGDYFALNAFLPFTGEGRREALEAVRHGVAEKLGVPSCLEIGPRYLHSTGQLHKGGPNTGVFLIVSADELKDIPLSQETESLGTLAKAQATGDLLTLASRGRRCMHLHLPDNSSVTLRVLASEVNEVLDELKAKGAMK